MTAMRPPWHKEGCWDCGQEGLATRADPKPESEPYYCAECCAHRTADAAHAEATKGLHAKIAKLERRVGRLDAVIASGQCVDLSKVTDQDLGEHCGYGVAQLPYARGQQMRAWLIKQAAVRQR